MNTRRVLLLLGVAGLVLFVFFFRHDLIESLRILRDTQWQYLLLILPVQAFSYLATSMFFRSVLGSIGAPKPKIGRLYGLSLGVNFTNAIFPSVGASGMSLMIAALKKDGVSTGQSTFAQLARYGIIYISFVFLLLFALATLYFGGGIARIAVRIVVLMLGLVLGISLVFAYLLYDRRGFNWLVTAVQRLIDWVSRRFRRGRDLIGHERVERILIEFHEGVQKMVAHKAYLKGPLGWGLLSNIAEVATLYIVFLALGFLANPGVVIVAYAVANGVGIISVIPGDIGVFEAAMVAVLSISGIPLAVSVSATILYRVINKALLLPLGLYFYNRYIKEGLDAAGH